MSSSRHASFSSTFEPPALPPSPDVLASSPSLTFHIRALERSNQRLRTGVTLALVAAAVLLLTAAQQPTPAAPAQSMQSKTPVAAKAQSRSTAPTLHQIYEDSRNERNEALQSNQNDLMVQARAHDVERRRLVRQLLASGSLRTAQDFREAAFIFLHGEIPQDFLLAHILSDAALAKGDASSRWSSAAALDRYLQSTAQPQIFGTQYQNPRATQDPYNKDLVPDSLRKDFCVPSYASQQQNRDAINSGKPMPFPDGCPLKSATAAPTN